MEYEDRPAEPKPAEVLGLMPVVAATFSGDTLDSSPPEPNRGDVLIPIREWPSRRSPDNKTLMSRRVWDRYTLPGRSSSSKTDWREAEYASRAKRTVTEWARAQWRPREQGADENVWSWKMVDSSHGLLRQQSYEICPSVRVDAKLLLPTVLASKHIRTGPLAKSLRLSDVHYPLIKSMIHQSLMQRGCKNTDFLWIFSKTWTFNRGRGTTTYAVEIEHDKLKATFLDAVHDLDQAKCTYLLESYYEWVAIEDLEWMHELKRMGCCAGDLAVLCLDNHAQLPWSREDATFLAQLVKHDVPLLQFHRRNCPHLLLENHGGEDRVMRSHSELPSRIDPAHTAFSQKAVSQLCGLAGIHGVDLDTPYVQSQNAQFDWRDHVNFSRGRSRPSVTYPKSHEYLRQSVANIIDASTYAQAGHICCDRWTIVVDNTWNATEVSGTGAPILALRTIHLDTIQDLLDSFSPVTERKMIRAARELLCQIAYDEYRQSSDSSRPPLQRFGRDIEAHPAFSLLYQNLGDPIHALSMVALLVQTLSLSLVSFTMAHLGTLRLECLMDNLTQVTLYGCGSGSHFVQMRAYEMTCLRNLANEPMRVFSLHLPDIPQALDEVAVEFVGKRHDLSATPQDLVDTFGGLLISDTEAAVQSCEIVAVAIGDGLITGPASDKEFKFHWDRDQLSSDPSPMRFASYERIVVGALHINERCARLQVATQKQVSAYSRRLGTYDPIWAVTERQFGFQGGQYLNFTAALTLNKVPGVTLKEMIVARAKFRQLNWNELELPVGLQLSSCTGLAQRVPLRVAVGQTLLHAQNARISPLPRWTELRDNHDIVVALTSLTLSNLEIWFKALPDHELRDLALTIICDQIDVLCMTGVRDDIRPNNHSDGKKYLTAIWPSEERPYASIHLGLNNEVNHWATILQDTSESATFAFVAETCLEGPAQVFKCSQNPMLGVSDLTRLLSSEIFRSSRAGSEASGIATDTIYRFGCNDDSLIAEVCRRDGLGALMVRISSSRTSLANPRIWQRFLKFKHVPRLSELGYNLRPDGAEQALVYSESFVPESGWELCTAQATPLGSLMGPAQPNDQSLEPTTSIVSSHGASQSTSATTVPLKTKNPSEDASASIPVYLRTGSRG